MKKIKEYIDSLVRRNFLVNEMIINLDEFVEYISYNSNDVKTSTLFVCKGNNFKKQYLDDAINKGAKWYISEKDYNEKIPVILVNDIKKALAVCSDIYYSFPGENLNLIGITGTKGKSSTLYYTKSVLDENAKFRKEKDTAIISTINTYLGKEVKKSLLTTPESLELRKDFYEANNNGVKNLVMEVSSQALKYDRVFDLKYNIALFLNISEDHISDVEHKDFEDYFSSKLKIFSQSENAVVNKDAMFSDRIYKEACKNCKKVVTFSLKDKEADVYAYDLKKCGMGTSFKVKHENNDEEYILNVPGKFNVENALAAICVGYLMNIKYEVIKEGIKKASSPGRMEIVSSTNKKIIGIVDYAHNKVSFEKIYEVVKTEYSNRYVISVFGCPGNKAQIRRKDLGQVSSINSDYIILTEDDPGYESTESICLEIADFVKKNTDQYEIILKRKDAIKRAMEIAKKINRDVVILILGKGEEMAQKKAGKLEDYEGDLTILKKII